MNRQRMLKTLSGGALSILLLLTAGCLPDLSHREIRDLERMPQAPSAYLQPATARQPLMTPERQQARAAEFLERFFLPWHAEAPLESTRGPFWAIDWIQENEVYGENLRPVKPERRQELIRQAAPESYPSLDRRAVTVRRCDLRALPTHRPLFNDPAKAGEGFPFDYLQHAALQANTPVRVTHLSEDGSWGFVETSLVFGWIPVTDIAWVDAHFARTFETGRYLALTRDRVVVFDSEGIYRFQGGIGTLLPVTGTEFGGHRVLLAVADRNRQAILADGTIPPDHGEVFPLPLTPRRLSILADRMAGQVYGWGESFSGRDCSATMRDLFAPFGFWLPRNSSKQALAGRVIPLSELAPARREERLLAEGVPFFTLVRVPGHIMLYLGEHEERAAVFHSLWGLRTRKFTGRGGRRIIGRTVVTTLEPGKELGGLFYGVGDLRSRVESINFLSPVDASPEPREKSHAATD